VDRETGEVSHRLRRMLGTACQPGRFRRKRCLLARRRQRRASMAAMLLAGPSTWTVTLVNTIHQLAYVAITRWLLTTLGDLVFWILLGRGGQFLVSG
jgi:hypothetical protein